MIKAIINESSTKVTVTYDYIGHNYPGTNYTKVFGSSSEFYEWQNENGDVFIWHVAGLYR
jgi:hypothetical protein